VLCFWRQAEHNAASTETLLIEAKLNDNKASSLNGFLIHQSHDAGDQTGNNWSLTDTFK
jgi:hypothetical protein